MPNKYEIEADAEEAKAEAPKKDVGFLTGDEAIAANEAKRSLLDPLAAYGNAAMRIIPGADYAQTKLFQALGHDPKDTVEMQHRLQAEYPGASLAGGISGGVVAGAGAAALGVPAAVGGLAGVAAVAASEAGLMTPIYKLGDILNDGTAQPTPLNIEQVSHAFDLNDVLMASGLTALFHVPGLLNAGAKSMAQSSAGRSMKEAAGKLQIEPSKLGRKALDTGILEQVGNADRLRQAAGAQMGEAVTHAKIDGKAKRDMVQALVDVQKGAVQNPEIDLAVANINAVAKGILDDTKLDGPRAHQQILTLKNMAAKAPSQAKQLYLNAKNALEDILEGNLDLVKPSAASDFRNGKHDYHLYSKISSEADDLAKRQMTKEDLGYAAAGGAMAHAVGTAIGGGPGAAVFDAGAALAGATRFKSKNTAVLLDKVSKMGPAVMYKTRMDAVMKGLMSPNMSAEVVSTMDDMQRYDDMVNMLQNHAGNPDATATNLRENLNFLPTGTADAVTANTMEKINKMCAEIPNSTAPATAFGVQANASDRQKREFLRKCDAKFDPYAAVMSGRKDLIQEAERCNPETVHEIKKAVIARISENPDSIDYVTRRKICGILGLPGVPGQDPTIGARIQGALNVRKEAQDAQGQMKSARQSNANLKNNSATLTRAQRILNDGD